MSILKSSKKRILIYSHDTFGLGHIRRCRAIAHGLVNEYKGLSVLILSGSPIISQFEFKARVDFIRIPGVIKLKDGRYTSLGLHIDLKETLSIRESIIRHTAESFNPDIFIVDKEPMGLQGEIEDTLKMLQSRDTTTILGLRDVLDDPQTLKQEWHRKNALYAVENYYDEIWVYGNKNFYQPLSGIDLSKKSENKIHYTGYIKRLYTEQNSDDDYLLARINKPYILVTTGGGKDGEEVIELLLNAYKKENNLPYDALVVLGPFMSKRKRNKFHKIADKLENVYMIDFHNRMETLIHHSSGMVSMGGYNTFCEILSLDKPSIIIPRFTPRLEQTIRAEQAEKLNLCKVLEPKDMNIDNFISLLLDMPKQAKPSKIMLRGFLSGLDKINKRIKKIIY